jgi:uncharacterized phage-associated protein
MMPVGYDVEKAAQVIAFLVNEQGGAADMIKTVKLAYMADRRFLELYDQPILNDDLYCLDHGPVDSTTLNYIKGEGSPDGLNIWQKYLTSVGEDYIFKTTSGDLYLGELNDAEEAVLKEVVAQFRNMKPFELVQWIHDNCPEWKNPRGGSILLPYREVFKALGKKYAEKNEKYVDQNRRLVEATR